MKSRYAHLGIYYYINKIMKKSLAVLLFAICCVFMSCRNNDTGKNNDIPAIDRVLLECNDKESLVYWTDSTICSSNPDLVLLLDTLYRHSRSEVFCERDTSELDWMKAYQGQVCRYYDRHNMGSSQITDYEKVCTVLKYAEKAYGEAGMGFESAVTNCIVADWSTFRDYAAFMQMQKFCKNKEQEKALFAEWKAWKDFEEAFTSFWTNCVELSYFGGSQADQVRTMGDSRISSAHISMYEREIYGFDDRGIFLECAEELFENCCNAILERCKIIYEDEDLAEFSSGRNKEIYNEAAKQNKIVLDKTCKWTGIRDEWTDAVSSDWCYAKYRRSTSEVLIQLSAILSSLDFGRRDVCIKN